MQVDANDLKRIVSAVAAVVPKSTAYPILHSIRLTARDGELTATASDLSTTVSSTTDCTDDLDVCIPAGLLHKAAGVLKGAVTIDNHGDCVSVETSGASYSIPTGDVGEWPRLDADEVVVSFDTPPGVLADAVSRAVVAADKTGHRATLMAVFFEQRGGRLWLAASDGYRLSIEDTCDAPEFPAAIIPLPALRTLERHAGDEAVSVLACWGSTRFRFGATEVATRHVAGEFPNYAKLIPSQSGEAIRVNSRALTDAIAQVTLVGIRGSATTPPTPVMMRVSNGAISLRAEHDGAFSDIDILAQGFAPGWDRIYFNPEYLIRAAESCENTCSIWIESPLKPVLVHGDGGHLSVIMPIRR